MAELQNGIGILGQLLGGERHMAPVFDFMTQK
jgi:hypothetical protein